jgi:hypothetical protein
MMNLISVWIGFVLLMSVSEELDLAHFALFSGSMFYFTYLYNQINPTVLSKKTTLLLFNIPTIILWYMAFVYNDFLCLNPMSYETFMGLFFLYFYATFYLLVNFPEQARPLISIFN